MDDLAAQLEKCRREREALYERIAKLEHDMKEWLELEAASPHCPDCGCQLEEQSETARRREDRIAALEEWGRQALKFISDRRAILDDGYALTEAGERLGLGPKEGA